MISFWASWPIGSGRPGASTASNDGDRKRGCRPPNGGGASTRDASRPRLLSFWLLFLCANKEKVTLVQGGAPASSCSARVKRAQPRKQIAQKREQQKPPSPRPLPEGTRDTSRLMLLRIPRQRLHQLTHILRHRHPRRKRKRCARDRCGCSTARILPAGPVT